MPKFLETKLKKEYGEKSAVPFKVMNSEGLMRGSKETPKGRRMEEKHEEKTMKQAPGHLKELRVEIHRGPAPAHKVTGFTVHHHMMPKATKSQAFMEHTSHTQPFSAKEHEGMMDHVAEHLESAMGAAPEASGGKAEAEDEA